jgi:excisionase family DNA binding protein
VVPDPLLGLQSIVEWCDEVKGAEKQKPDDKPAEDKWITITEAGKLLGVDKGTVSRWADTGRITDNKKKGRGRKVSKATVLLLKEEREHEDRLKDAADVLQDEAGKIPDRH